MPPHRRVCCSPDSIGGPEVGAGSDIPIGFVTVVATIPAPATTDAAPAHLCSTDSGRCVANDRGAEQEVNKLRPTESRVARVRCRQQHSHRDDRQEHRVRERMQSSTRQNGVRHAIRGKRQSQPGERRRREIDPQIEQRVVVHSSADGNSSRPRCRRFVGAENVKAVAAIVRTVLPSNATFNRKPLLGEPSEVQHDANARRHNTLSDSNTRPNERRATNNDSMATTGPGMGSPKSCVTLSPAH